MPNESFLTSRIEEALGWARKFSIFQYPFVTACCGMEYMATACSHYDVDRFGAAQGRHTPVIEATGTGGGFKLFCAGVGVGRPDIANASRPIKESERAACAEAGVQAITEIRIGFDGIVLARARGHGALDLTLRQIFLALAKRVRLGGEQDQ